MSETRTAFSGTWPPDTQTDTLLEEPNRTEVTQRFAPRLPMIILLAIGGTSGAGYLAWRFDIL